MLRLDVLLRGWIAQVARNAALDQIRAQPARGRRPASDQAMPSHEPLPRRRGGARASLRTGGAARPSAGYPFIVSLRRDESYHTSEPSRYPPGTIARAGLASAGRPARRLGGRRGEDPGRRTVSSHYNGRSVLPEASSPRPSAHRAPLAAWVDAAVLIPSVLGDLSEIQGTWGIDAGFAPASRDPLGAVAAAGMAPDAPVLAALRAHLNADRRGQRHRAAGGRDAPRLRRSCTSAAPAPAVVARVSARLMSTSDAAPGSAPRRRCSSAAAAALVSPARAGSQRRSAARVA